VFDKFVFLQNSEFDVQEIPTPQLHCRPMSYRVKLNEWWCDCGEFQVLKLPCPHVIVVCSFCHLQLGTFVSLVYSLNNIFKTYEIQFHLVHNHDYWSPYTGPNMIPDPHMREANLEDQLQIVSIMKWMTQLSIGLKNVCIVEMKVTIGQIVPINSNFLM